MDIDIESIFQETSQILDNYRNNSEVVDIYNDEGPRSKHSPFHEVNLVHCFALGASKVLEDAVPFFEVSVDSGRIDLIVIAREATILVEAKSKIDHHAKKKLVEMDEQLARVHGGDKSIRALIDERIPKYRSARWKSTGKMPLYGVGLTYCSDKKYHETWNDEARQFETLSDFQRGFHDFQGKFTEHLLYLYASSKDGSWVKPS